MLQNTQVTKIMDISLTDLFSGTINTIKNEIAPTYSDIILDEHLYTSDTLEEYEQSNKVSAAILTDFALIREAMDANECSYFRLITS